MFQENNNIVRLPKSLLTSSIIIAVLGIGVWIYQLVSGMQVTGLDDGVVWGLYIAAFFVAAGGGAALLVLAGILEFQNNINPILKRNILMLAITAFIVAGILITMDLGSPLQIFLLITSFKYKSMMVLDFWMLALCFIVALIFLLQVRKNENGSKFLGLIAIVVALLVVILESFMLTSIAARDMWGSGIITISFLISASIVGCALAMLIVPHSESFRKIFLTTLAMGLVISLAEVFTGAFTGNPETKARMLNILSGNIAPFFWGQIAIGLLIPIFLLVRNFKSVIAAILAIVGVVLEKTWILAAGQAKMWLQDSLQTYFPSLLEYIIVIGVVALGVVLFGVMQKLFNVKASPPSIESDISVA